MNAKEELLEELDKKPKVKCAEIKYIGIWNSNKKVIRLKLKYSDKDWEQFLNELDFNYDDGYGGQELFGTLWFEDGSWLERGEYDGSEWWIHKKTPQIPDSLNLC